MLFQTKVCFDLCNSFIRQVNSTLELFAVFAFRGGGGRGGGRDFGGRDGGGRGGGRMRGGDDRRGGDRGYGGGRGGRGNYNCTSFRPAPTLLNLEAISNMYP